MRPSEYKFTLEEAKRGGQNSAKVRREKKTIQRILGDYLDSDIATNKSLEAIAKKAGISTEGSIKELVTAICVLNTLKKGDVSELEKVARLLGEQPEATDSEAQKQADFLDAVKRAVANGD